MAEHNSQISKEAEEIFTDLQPITDSLNVSTLLIGAQSRIFILDQRFNVEGRKTTDWDVAVRLSSSEVYEQLVKQMTGGTASFQATSNPYRFIHKRTGLEVDILPFGEIVDGLDKPVRLSLLGLQEVAENSEIEVINDLKISVPKISSYLLLKLLTWYDRREIRDLQDIKLVLQTYQVDDEQIFQELFNELSEGEIEFDEASIYLLGKEIHRIFGNENLTRVNQVISYLLEHQNQVLSQIVGSTEDWDSEFAKFVRYFEILQLSIKK